MNGKSQNPAFRAVIFDMDGVIVDSEPLHVEAERRTFEPFGVALSEEELHEFKGRSPRVLMQALIERYGLGTSVDALYPRHMEHLRELYKGGARPIRGVLSFIRRCSRSGCRLGIASGSDLELIRIVLKKLRLEPWFDAVASNEEVKNPKPSPDVFLLAAARMGCDPASCVVVEDSKAGVLAARSAGMRCIGYMSPNSPGQDLREADRIVDSFSRIPSRLEAWFRDGETTESRR